MTNPLYRVPGLGGFIASGEQREREDANQLQKVAGVLGLQGALQKQAQEQAFRRDIQALGPEPAAEAVTSVAAKYADPKSLLEIYQRTAERKEAAKERGLQFAQNLELRQQQLDLQREQFNQRTADAAARMQFEEIYKTETLRNRQAADQLNAQLRTLGFEIQKQGQQLQIQRFDAEQAGKLQRQVEGLSKRGDDLASLYSGINEVNAVLEPYVSQGKNVPGLGYGTNIEVMGMDVSGPFLGEDGKKVRSAVKNVANKILKAESGAAVTLPEEVRQNLALMATGQFSEKDFLNAWPRVVAAMQSNLDNIAAGYDPKALEMYRQRGGSLPFGAKLRVPQQPAPASSSEGASPPPPPGFKLVTP
jgi:hypothetical protein